MKLTLTLLFILMTFGTAAAASAPAKDSVKSEQPAKKKVAKAKKADKKAKKSAAPKK
jgi:hypothetical protein